MPSRGRRLFLLSGFIQCFCVSIHAFTRKATAFAFSHGPYLSVSIHAFTRKATSSVMENVSLFVFQSTPSRGRRLDIHANGGVGRWFQSTPSRGRRLLVTAVKPNDPRFQSTPSRGRRLHDDHTPTNFKVFHIAYLSSVLSSSKGRASKKRSKSL